MRCWDQYQCFLFLSILPASITQIFSIRYTPAFAYCPFLFFISSPPLLLSSSRTDVLRRLSCLFISGMVELLSRAWSPFDFSCSPLAGDGPDIVSVFAGPTDAVTFYSKAASLPGARDDEVSRKSLWWHPEQNAAGERAEVNSRLLTRLFNLNKCERDGFSTDESRGLMKTLNVCFAFPNLCSIWENMQIRGES